MAIAKKTAGKTAPIAKSKSGSGKPAPAAKAIANKTPPAKAPAKKPAPAKVVAPVKKAVAAKVTVATKPAAKAKPAKKTADKPQNNKAQAKKPEINNKTNKTDNHKIVSKKNTPIVTPAKKVAPVKKAAPAAKAAPAKNTPVPVKKKTIAPPPAKSPAKPAAKAPAKPAPKAPVKSAAKAPAKPAPKPAPKAPAKPVAKAAPVKAAPAPQKAPAAPAPRPSHEKKAPIKKKLTITQMPVKFNPAAPKPMATPAARSIEKKPTVVIAHRKMENKSKLPKEIENTMVTYMPETYRSILDEPAQQQGPAYRYSDEDLAEFKEIITSRLEAARKELNYLQGLITRKDEAGTEDTENRYMNMEDGSGAMEREQLAQLASRQIQFMSHLEKALVRIENKTYGICRVTGKLIDKARLRAVPHATLSIEAKKLMAAKQN